MMQREQVLSKNWAVLGTMLAGCLLLSPAWSASARGTDKVDATALTEQGAVKIWSVRRRDGSIELTDMPRAAGAGVRTHVYAEARAREVKRQAELERDYWQRQSDAFAARRVSRIEADARLREAEARLRSASEAGARRFDANGMMVWPVVVGAPQVRAVQGSAVYVTSPGAVQGRGWGALNAGFGPAAQR